MVSRESDTASFGAARFWALAVALKTPVHGFGLLNTPEGGKYGSGFGIVWELPHLLHLAARVLRPFFKPRFGVGVVFSAGAFLASEGMGLAPRCGGALEVLQRHIGDEWRFGGGINRVERVCLGIISAYP